MKSDGSLALPGKSVEDGGQFQRENVHHESQTAMNLDTTVVV